MSIPEWFSLLKDKFTDAASFAVAARHVELLESHVDLLKSQVEILTMNIAENRTQLGEARERLSVLEAENSRLREDNAQLRKNDEFKEFHGIAFKRLPDGGFEEAPRCPQCYAYLSSNSKSTWRSALICNSCNYSPDPRTNARDMYQKLIRSNDEG